MKKSYEKPIATRREELASVTAGSTNGNGSTVVIRVPVSWVVKGSR